ncbi:hypothetical protein IJT17_03590, partial [bacterium]|nr:hypothetical protein [bacterium]
MEPEIRLCAKAERFNTTLKLHRHRPELSDDGAIYIVYQVKYEEYHIRGLAEGSINKYNLWINDVQVHQDSEKSFIDKEGIHIAPADGNSFANIFGFASICLHLTMKSGEQIFWFTNALAVAFDESEKESDKDSKRLSKKEYCASLMEMFADIDRKDSAMLLYHPRYAAEQVSDNGYLPLLKVCIERLHHFLPFIRVCRRDIGTYSSRAARSEQQSCALYQPYSLSRMQAQASSFMPGWLPAPAYRRLAGRESGSSAGSYEIRSIVAFVLLMLQTVRSRMLGLDAQHKREEPNIPCSLEPGYTLSSSLLKQLAATITRERLREAEELESSINELYALYSQSLGAVCSTLPELPRLTPEFLQNPYYRGVFELMSS